MILSPGDIWTALSYCRDAIGRKHAAAIFFRLIFSLRMIPSSTTESQLWRGPRSSLLIVFQTCIVLFRIEQVWMHQSHPILSFLGIVTPQRFLSFSVHGACP